MEKIILTSSLNQTKYSEGTYKKPITPIIILVYKTNKLVRLKN